MAQVARLFTVTKCTVENLSILDTIGTAVEPLNREVSLGALIKGFNFCKTVYSPSCLCSLETLSFHS